MIIVNQNKTMIINFTNILALAISSLLDGSIAIKMYEPNNKTGTTIARYGTTKRAKEVLKEIIERNQEYALVQNGIINDKDIVMLSKIYEMPAE